MLSTNRIKYIRSLHQKKYRQKYSQFLVEGVKTIQEFINRGSTPSELYCRQDFDHKLNSFEEHGLLPISDTQMGQISSFKTAPEVIGLFNYPTIQMSIDESKPLIALDNISDPGNLGTIIRIADWYGVKQIVVSPNTVDEYNPKTIAATMGSFSGVNIIRTDLLPLLNEYPKAIYSAVLDGDSIYQIKNVEDAFCLLIGSESHGISDEILNQLKTLKTTIPKKGQAESLNAAVATGILIDRLLNG